MRTQLHLSVLGGVVLGLFGLGFSPLWAAAPGDGDDVPVTEAPDNPGAIEVDRIVAVVDEDPIFASDIERLIALGLAEPRPDESPEQLQRRVLSSLIDQRLHLHVVERFDFGASPSAEVDRQLAALRGRFENEEAFAAQLQLLGLDEGSLRLLLARQLRILIYIEERLGPKVFVDQEDVRAYFEETLIPTMAAQGVEAVPFEEVRDDIRTLLRERRLNSEVEQWTEGLRLQAQIIDLLDRSDRPLPPVVNHLPADHKAPHSARGW